MNATLPHGLITISHTKVSDDNNSHYADILFERHRVLHSFWKVHAVRHRVSKDPSDFRCQNLFWRTWGDPDLSKTISTAALTSLWSLCQQCVDPTALRRGIELAPPVSNDAYATAASQLHRSDSTSSAQAGAFTSTPVVERSSAQRSRAAPNLSIRRVSIDESGGFGAPIDGNRKSPRSSRPALARVSSTSNRIAFGASTGKPKSRPSMNRRKSSNSAPQGKSARLSKTALKSPTESNKDLDNMEVLPSDSITSPFELPSASSWEDEPTADKNRLAKSVSNSTAQSDLVEPNFRNKFAERIASTSNLAGMDRLRKTGSVVRFADEMPTDLRTAKDSLPRLSTGHEHRNMMSFRGSANSVNSIAVVDEYDMSSPDLPRTKSQLSMMIQESRSKQGRTSFESPEPSEEHVGLSSRRRRDPTDHEKVLAMAHGEGVTKSGGRRIRRGFKFGNEDESRYSSPSPEPIF